MAGKRAGKGLNDRQEAFCREYLVDNHATNAAIRAGYSPKTCYAIGSKLLKNVEIQARIDELAAKILAKKRMTPEKVLDEWRKLATFDARKLFWPDGTPKAITDLDDDTAAAIVGLDTVTVGNADLGIGQILKFKLASKQAALDSIAKHFGMFVDRQEITGRNGGPIETAVGNADELARRIAFMLQNAAPEVPALPPPAQEFP